MSERTKAENKAAMAEHLIRQYEARVASELAASALLADLVRAYEREVNPAPNWTETAMTEEEFRHATKEYRAAKEWLSPNDKTEPQPPTATVADGKEPRT